MNAPDPPEAAPLPPLLEAAETPPPVARWRWAVHLLILATYVAALPLLGLSRRGPGDSALPADVPGLVQLCAIEVGLFFAALLTAWCFSRASADDLLLRWRGGPWPVLRGLAYSVALRLAVGVALAIVLGVIAIVSREGPDALLRHRPKIENVVDVNALGHDPVYLLLSLTLVSFVLAGLREELWRAGMLAGLRNLAPAWFGGRWGALMAVTLIAVLFGLGHLPQGWSGVAVTALLGVGLGAIIVFHRSIWEAVLAHGFFDATSFALLPWVARIYPEVLGG